MPKGGAVGGKDRGGSKSQRDNARDIRNAGRDRSISDAATRGAVQTIHVAKMPATPLKQPAAKPSIPQHGPVGNSTPPDKTLYETFRGGVNNLLEDHVKPTGTSAGIFEALPVVGPMITISEFLNDQFGIQGTAPTGNNFGRGDTRNVVQEMYAGRAIDNYNYSSPGRNQTLADIAGKDNSNYQTFSNAGSDSIAPNSTTKPATTEEKKSIAPMLLAGAAALEMFF